MRNGSVRKTVDSFRTLSKDKCMNVPFCGSFISALTRLYNLRGASESNTRRIASLPRYRFALSATRGAISPVTLRSRQSERFRPSGGGVWVGREKKGERRKTGKGRQNRNGAGRWIYYMYFFLPRKSCMITNSRAATRRYTTR